MVSWFKGTCRANIHLSTLSSSIFFDVDTEDTYLYIVIILYLTSGKIQIKDKTNYKSHSLQLALFTPN